jgi:ribosomal protein S18 acetylase RimI-like enzyme
MKITLEHIQQHLKTCSSIFTPKLSSYVDIEQYSKKIFDHAKLFVEFDKNKMIGLVAAYDNSMKKIGWITNVSVDPGYVRKGIASRLMNECRNYFEKRGYLNIFLEVYCDNKKAIELYTKHGFIVHKNNNNIITLNQQLKMRDYNKEFEDTPDHKYVYNFDFDVMHHYMIKSFNNHFVKGNCLELGSFKGDFTKRLVKYFDDITCVEASDEAIKVAKTLNGGQVKYVNGMFEDVSLPNKFDNIVFTHVLEHITDPVSVLKKINNEWLSDTGRLFLVCPNANAPSRQIAVKMGLISHNSAVTPSEKDHGHQITYSMDTLERDAKLAGLKVVHRSGIFFKALANFQWDQLLKTEIISKEYLDGCYELGQQYPDLCSSIFLLCEKGK